MAGNNNVAENAVRRKKGLFNNPHKVLPQLLAAVIGSWGFFCTGVVRGWSSPGIPSLNRTLDFEMSPTDFTWIASMPPLCALFGSLLVGFPMQIIGRRKSLIALCVPFITGFLLMGFTYFGRHKAMLYVGRIMSGLMNGAATPASQIYISECSSPRIRGTLSSLTATALSLGILVTYIIGAFVDWYVLAWILAGFPFVLLVGMIFMPETPTWLLTHDREEEARKSLQFLRGSRTNVESEFQRMKDNLRRNANQQQKISPKELLKGSVWKPLGISMGIMFFQQFTGINAMVFYTVSIFQSAGSSIESRYATIIVGFVQFICTIISGFMVDRFGRRILLLSSASVVSLALAAMGSFFYMQHLWGEAEASATLGWLPLLSLIVFFVAFSGGFSNVPFIIMGELFPSRYRTLLGPITSSFNLLCTFTVVRSFPEMQIAMGKYGAFWFFMCCTLLSIIFIFFLLPETKGKTLEEIEKLFTVKNVEGGADPTKQDPVTKESLKMKNVLESVCVELGNSEDVKTAQKSFTTCDPTFYRPELNPFADPLNPFESDLDESDDNGVKSCAV